MNTRQDQRTQLYFGKYSHSLRFDMPMSYAMRSLSSRFINNMFKIEAIHRRGTIKAEYVDQWHQNCLALFELLNTTTVAFKRLCYFNSQIIYSNDLDWLRTLGELEYIEWPEITEVVITGDPNKVRLQNSQHNFRSWFRSRSYNEDEKRLISQFLLSRSEYFRIPTKLRERLQGEHFYDQPTNYDFIDHVSEHDVLMLNMIVPNCIKKTLPIEVVTK